MVNYVPPPKDLSRLNPIQRYFHKGALETADYYRLVFIAILWWFLRPYVQRFFKYLSKDVQKGEEEEDAYKERRAKAADMRPGKQKAEGKTLGELLDDGPDGMMAQSTGVKSSTAGDATPEVKSRKQPKKKGVSFAPEKTDAERTLDWEDESEFDPRRPPVVAEGGQPQSGDIKAWMEKWTA